MLKFVANPNLTPTNGNSRFYDQMIQGGNAEITAGELLYKVYAKNTPKATTVEDWFQIGEIKSTSTFVKSLWGDERLFFQHQALYHDLRELSSRDKREVQDTVPTFNLEKYGEWNNPVRFEIEEASAEDVIDGILTTGCPFAFMID